MLIGALPTDGDLKLTLDKSVYVAGDSGTVLDVSFEIPYTSLSFLRQGGEFVARYQLSVQVSDARRDMLVGDVWQKAVRLSEYDATVARDSVETGAVSLFVPVAALDVRVEVSDQGSERSALALFRIDRPTGGLAVRLYKSGRPASLRKYGIGDTLVAVAEAVSPQDRIDSCRFVLKHDRRVVTCATVAATDSPPQNAGNGATGGAQRRAAAFSYPIGDSTGLTRLGGGEYLLEVAGLGAGRPLNATERFRVEVPFFLDDSAYQLRVRQLIYVASAEEVKQLRSVPRGERERVWRDFWKKKSRSPISGRYVSEDEYFERIDYAQEHFDHGDRGYLSDRGQVYVRYGPPDQIDARPFDIDSPAYEVWYYYELNRQFEFVDRFGAGEYVLQNREALGE